MVYANSEVTHQTAHLRTLIRAFAVYRNIRYNRICWRTEKVLIRQFRCEGWSEPSLFAYGINVIFNIMNRFNVFALHEVVGRAWMIIVFSSHLVPWYTIHTQAYPCENARREGEGGGDRQTDRDRQTSRERDRQGEGAARHRETNREPDRERDR